MGAAIGLGWGGARIFIASAQIVGNGFSRAAGRLAVRAGASQLLAHMDVEVDQAPAQLERVDGAVRLVCGRRGARSVLKDIYQRAPCRVLFPDAEADEHLSPVLLTTSGGLTGGDKLRISIVAEADAQATISTQAAEKIYRALDGACEVEINLKAHEGAWLEWLMQETIVFDRARLRRRTDIDLADSARLLAVESIVFGRAAMGETFSEGSVSDRWRVRRGGRLAWVESVAFRGETMRRPFALGEAAGCATILYVGADANAHLGAARAALASFGVRGGATCLGDVLVARLLAADATALRAAVAGVVSTLRSLIAGLPARLPRVWSC